MTDELKPVEKMTRKQLEKEAAAAGLAEPWTKLDSGLRAVVRIARRKKEKQTP